MKLRNPSSRPTGRASRAKPRLLVLFALLALPSLAPCKDFPEPVLAADSLAAASRPGLSPGMGASFEYGNYVAAHDDVDSFYFRLSASPVLLDVGEAFALGATFESVLMCGPIGPGETAVNAAAFWMNATQFEYGLYASSALPGLGRAGPHLLAEYSRTSQHPMRPAYSEVSADILMLGLALPRLSLGPDRGAGSTELLSYVRAGYRDLFAFWQSALPKPRVSWVLKPAAELQVRLTGALFAVARAYPELFIDRYTGGPDANLFAEAGLAVERGADSSELLFTVYETRDSDLLRAGPHPTFEAGLALRLSQDRTRPAEPPPP
jgi:hypothetical protein